jgi:hypothetical protein
MKGALGLIVICIIIWVFWMSWMWLRKETNSSKKDPIFKFTKQTDSIEESEEKH